MAKKFRKGGPWRCWKCGALNAGTVEVCGSCKTPFDGTEESSSPVVVSSSSGPNADRGAYPIEGKAVMKCPNCGAENPDYVIYCGSCASLLHNESTKNRRQSDKGQILWSELTQQPRTGPKSSNQ